MKPFLFLTLLLLLTACGGNPDAISGSVTLSYPPDGTIVYASALHLKGMLADVPSQSLLIRLANTGGVTLSETILETEAGEWSLDLVHGYTGEPSEAIISILPAEKPEAGVFASTTILLAALEHRPEGVYVDVRSPVDGAEAGGDSIEVTGRVSGAESVRLELVSSNGAVIDSKTIETGSVYLVDDVPFTTGLATTNYTGTALLNIYAGDELVESRTIIMTSAAG